MQYVRLTLLESRRVAEVLSYLPQGERGRMAVEANAPQRPYETLLWSLIFWKEGRPKELL